MGYGVPEDVLAAMHGGQEPGSSATTSGSSSWNWQEYVDAMSGSSFAAKGPKVKFWLALSIPVANFSDLVEMHETLPMMIPASGIGTLAGVFPTKADMDAALAEEPHHVHLTYKVNMEGQEKTMKFIEYLAENGMIEKEN